MTRASTSPGVKPDHSQDSGAGLPSRAMKRRRFASPIASFEAKYIPEPNTGCWLWFGAANDDGYGHLSVGAGREMLAHRFSFQRFRGPLISGLVLDHLCRQTYCVNPDHLEQVTQTTNVRRGGPRLHATCRNGHPWNEENTWRNPLNGWRQCRACNRENARRMLKRRVSA